MVAFLRACPSSVWSHRRAFQEEEEAGKPCELAKVTHRVVLVAEPRVRVPCSGAGLFPL